MNQKNVTWSSKVKGGRIEIQFREQFTQEKHFPLPKSPKKYFQASMAQKNPNPAKSIEQFINQMKIRKGIDTVTEFNSLIQRGMDLCAALCSTLVYWT